MKYTVEVMVAIVQFGLSFYGFWRVFCFRTCPDLPIATTASRPTPDTSPTRSWSPSRRRCTLRSVLSRWWHLPSLPPCRWRLAHPGRRVLRKARPPGGQITRESVTSIDLLEQHVRIRELFRDVSTAEGEHKQQAFDELRALLGVHETAEEMVLRPVSKRVAGEQVVDARNEEEQEANKVLAELEKMDVSTPDFDAKLAKFERAVSDHAEQEESEEFPHVLSTCDMDERAKMGKRIRAAESVAPTHPHPSSAGSTTAQWTVGPFASLVDRTRDLISKAG